MKNIFALFLMTKIFSNVIFAMLAYWKIFFVEQQLLSSECASEQSDLHALAVVAQGGGGGGGEAVGWCEGAG